MRAMREETREEGKEEEDVLYQTPCDEEGKEESKKRYACRPQ
jgi:hypothetical protein